MYNRHSHPALGLIICVLLSVNVYSDSAAPINAPDIRCALEFDGDQTHLSEAEIPNCLTTDDGANICPLQLLACTSQPVTTYQQVITNGTCYPASGNTFECALDQTTHTTELMCDNACKETTLVPTTTYSPPTCPIGNHIACHDVAGQSMCSPNQCFDAQATSNTSPLLLEGQSHDAMNSDGECTGEIQIFPGVKSGCRLGGVQTRWDNCCNNGNKVISDAFDNPIRQGMNIAESLYGLVDSVLGTSNASIVAEIDRTLHNMGFYVGTDFIVDVANYLFTPCAKDSVPAAMIASGYCSYVGTKCVEDWGGAFGGCVQRAEVHCCFNSMMAKIVHDQGRQQLNNFSFGSVHNPNCNGFTLEQFQALDFSKFDFSAYEQEIIIPDSQALFNKTQNASQDAIDRFGTGTP